MKTAVDLKKWSLSAGNSVDKSKYWIINSGATQHMTSDEMKFAKLEDYSSRVEVANADQIEVTGRGEIALSLLDSTGRSELTHSDVLFVPRLEGHLSIGRIEEKGFKVQFDDGKAKAIDRSGCVVLTAHRRGRLYIAEENQPKGYISKTANEELWHRRLVHPHNRRIKVDGTNLEATQNKPCAVCKQGNMNRNKFPKPLVQKLSKY